MRHTFQVDLRGMIDLLSEHLYGGPEVYLRELLQNGVDALTARAAAQPGHRGGLTVTLTPGVDGPPILTFEDDGIGLDADGVHAFLATIGRSSKRGDRDFIGQFGIGLLSCFVVADEIELVTRSVTGASAVRWTGYADGQYTLTELDPEDETARTVGTRVVLRAKSGREGYFDPERVRAWCASYAALLPYPVTVRCPEGESVVNDRPAPWDTHAEGDALRAALIDGGADLLGVDPFDAVVIRTAAGDVRGVAYVLPWTPTLAVRGRHRVYLRGMLLSEDSEHLVPDWAFFVKCILDARDLRPNAARDALYEDASLHAAREEIGRALRDYLLRLAEHEPARLRALIALHYLSIKALAVEDDEFFELFLPWLPFETSLGRITLPEFLRRSTRVRFVSDLNLFRQVGQVAVASGQAVVHAVYTHDAALLEKYGALHPEVSVERLDAASFAADLAELGPDERREHATFVRAANEVLLDLGCEAR
ncbi:HSP90 family protein, partial [Deinococcus pimensis]|uniref:HSP90 family protein n=1 Tax=Deinococcus pimensis TaxID=309888 RepID=UPI00069452B3